MAAAVVSLVLLAALLLSSTTAEVRTPDMYTGGDWQSAHDTTYGGSYALRHHGCWLRIVRCVPVLLNYKNLMSTIGEISLCLVFVWIDA
jgi:hypothetical protein